MNKRLVVGVTGVVALSALIASAWVVVSREQPNPANLLPAKTDKLAVDTVSLDSQWQWRAVEVERQQKSPSSDESSQEIPYDVVAIHDALANVQIDASGNIIIDESSLPSLQLAFRRLGDSVSPEMVEQLQSLVKIGLPGEAGKQVSALLGQYYNYQLALVDVVEQPHAVEPDARAESASAAELRLESLSELRRKYFDRRTALDLFGAEEAHQRYLLRRKEIQQSDLPAEERQEAMAQLKNNFGDGIYYLSASDREFYEELSQFSSDSNAPLSSDLSQTLNQQILGLVSAVGGEEGNTTAEGQTARQRVSRFVKERNAIVNAGLSEGDKLAQIEWLMSQHFTEAEVEASKSYLPAYRSLQ